MIITLKLTRIGNSTGLLLPREMVRRMKLARRQVLQAVETPEGYLLLPADPTPAQGGDLGRDLMQEYRETLAALSD